MTTCVWAHHVSLGHAENIGDRYKQRHLVPHEFVRLPVQSAPSHDEQYGVLFVVRGLGPNPYECPQHLWRLPLHCEGVGSPIGHHLLCNERPENDRYV